MILLHLFIFFIYMLAKSSLESNISPKCFTEGANCILLFLKVKSWWDLLSRLCKKQTAFAGSGVNNIFHWHFHWLIKLKSIFTSISKCFLLIAVKKSDGSSVNILHDDVTPSGKSFILLEVIRTLKQIFVKHLLFFYH